MFELSNNHRSYQFRRLASAVSFVALAAFAAGAPALAASRTQELRHVLPPERLCPGMIYVRWLQPPCIPYAYWPWWYLNPQFLVSGASSPNGVHSIATQFTVAENSVATEIDIPISYVSGTDSAVNVSVAADDGGIPGKVLATRRLESLPAAGACCSRETIKLKPRLTLMSGAYWIVATADDGSDTEATWNLDLGDQINPQTAAFDSGSGWTTQSILPAVSVAVRGK